MRITITMDVYEDEIMVDPASESGLTAKGYEWITRALWRYGEDVEITKDEGASNASEG